MVGRYAEGVGPSEVVTTSWLTRGAAIKRTSISLVLLPSRCERACATLEWVGVHEKTQDEPNQFTKSAQKRVRERLGGGDTWKAGEGGLVSNISEADAYGYR